MAVTLVALSVRKLPGSGHMPVVGTSSQAIAAACHVSPLSRAEDFDVKEDGKRAENPSTKVGGVKAKFKFRLGSETRTKEKHEEKRKEAELEYQDMDPEMARLTRISRSLLSWGIVPMPEGWSQEVGPAATESLSRTSSSQDVEVVHMSFGTRLDGVTAPEEGKWYLFR